MYVCMNKKLKTFKILKYIIITTSVWTFSLTSFSIWSIPSSFP